MNKKFIILLPILSGMFWGLGGVFTRILHNIGLNSHSILATRLVIATLILFTILLFYDKGSFKVKIQDLWIFVCTGILGTMLLNLCYNEAAFTLTLSLASVLLSLAPIFAMFLSAKLFDEKITKRKIICLVITLIGCVLVTGVLESNISISVHGLIFGLLSALFWALYGIFSKMATNRGYSTYTTLFYSFLVNSIVLLPITDWSTFNSFLIVNPLTNVPFALLHSLLIAVLPYFLFTYGLNYVENGKATILCSSAEPTSATIFGLLFFSEVSSMLNIIGIFITIIGLALLVSSQED